MNFFPLVLLVILGFGLVRACSWVEEHDKAFRERCAKAECPEKLYPRVTFEGHCACLPRLR